AARLGRGGTWQVHAFGGGYGLLHERRAVDAAPRRATVPVGYADPGKKIISESCQLLPVYWRQVSGAACVELARRVWWRRRVARTARQQQTQQPAAQQAAARQSLPTQ